MGNFSSATGTVTLIMMLLGRSIFAKFGWRFAALVTPTVSNIWDFCFVSSHSILTLNQKLTFLAS